jgi:TRAP-type mannitol/chloroaromatic compound transport system substrate-binding protein
VNELPKYYQSVLEQAGHFANTWMMAKYDELNPALQACSPTAPSCTASRRRSWKPVKAAKDLHAEIAVPTSRSRRSTTR